MSLLARPLRPSVHASGARRGRANALACRATLKAGTPSAKRVIAATLAAAGLLLESAGAAHADRNRVAEFAASGLLFKDQVEVTALDDPEIEGVTIYFSDFKRNIVDKLQKDFFAEPSQASLTCVVSGPVRIKDEKKLTSFEGTELFSEQKGLNIFKNKTLRVRRVYDAERRNVLYVAYSTRLSTAADEGGVSTGRYRTSLCAVSLPPVPVPAPPVMDAPAVPTPAPAVRAAAVSEAASSQPASST